MKTAHIKEMAIVTAYHDLDWCPQTPFGEVWDDKFFNQIRARAELILAAAEVPLAVTAYDVADAIWDMSAAEFEQEFAE